MAISLASQHRPTSSYSPLTVLAQGKVLLQQAFNDDAYAVLRDWDTRQDWDSTARLIAGDRRHGLKVVDS